MKATYVAGLHDDSDTVRRAAAAGLGELGGAAHDAIPQLRELLDDEYYTVADAAKLAIARIDRARR